MLEVVFNAGKVYGLVGTLNALSSTTEADYLLLLFLLPRFITFYTNYNFLLLFLGKAFFFFLLFCFVCCFAICLGRVGLKRGSQERTIRVFSAGFFHL